MALGAIVNANNAFLPPDFNPTLNHRFVYRPYFGDGRHGEEDRAS